MVNSPAFLLAVAQGIPFMARLLLAAAQGILSRICTVGRYSPTKLRNGAFLLAKRAKSLRSSANRKPGFLSFVGL